MAVVNFKAVDHYGYASMNTFISRSRFCLSFFRGAIKQAWDFYITDVKIPGLFYISSKAADFLKNGDFSGWSTLTRKYARDPAGLQTPWHTILPQANVTTLISSLVMVLALKISA